MTQNALKLSIIIYKIFMSRTRKYSLSNPLPVNKERSRLKTLKEIRRIYSRLTNERFLFMKMLTETYTFQKRRSPFMSWENIKRKFTYIHWLKFLRMGKDTFNILTEKLTPFVESHNINAPVEKQIAVALMSMASGKSNKHIGHLFSLSKLEVANIIHNVCEAIKKLMPQYLKAPSNQSVNEIIKNFEAKWGFPQCAGVLGSIHIPLRTSNLPENASDYINSDNSHSIVLQGIADESYKFWDINVGWPGSVPESRVFTSSALWLKGQDRNLFPECSRNLCDVDVPVFILAGSSYPLSHWVLRPFLIEAASKDEQMFNEKFTFAYNASEIAFKRLKARWNCLVRGNICSIDILPSVIAACCILHNICETHKEMIFDEWIVKAENLYKQPIPFPCNTVIGPQAESIRKAVKDYFASTK